MCISPSTDNGAGKTCLDSRIKKCKPPIFILFYQGQAQWRWHDAGLQGGAHTATNGRSVWSSSKITGPKLYRADVGSENVAAWGLCNFSFFYTFPGVLCLPEGTASGGNGMVPGQYPWPTSPCTCVSELNNGKALSDPKNRSARV